MLRKILITIAGLILSLSLFLNYIFIRGKNNPVVSSDAGVYFNSIDDSQSLSVDGCLLWHDPKQRSTNFYQYWKVMAIVRKGTTLCSVVRGTQRGETVRIDDPDTCQVTNLDAGSKVATIVYKDAVVTVNGDRAIWATSNPNEKGGGDLVPCYDRRLGWYPW
jgi:hypothetical protein